MVEKRDGHAIALQRIDEEAERRTGKLDLSGLGLTHLTPGLFELVHLRSLDLGAYEGWQRRLDGSRGNYQDISNSIAADLNKLRQLPSLTSLSIASSNAADLAFIAELHALQWLNCSRTQIVSLEPLAGLPALQWLNCSGTSAASLKALASLTALQSLDCSSTQVTSLEPLAGLSALQSLNCSFTQIASLEPLAGLLALQLLNCWNTQVASLGPLAGLPALQSLDCSYTPLTSLEPLANLPRMQSIDCSYTQIASLEPLAGLSTLQRLNCTYTQVASLEPLAGLPTLHWLNCSYTPVASLEPLAGLPEPQWMGYPSTRAALRMPPSGLPSLQSLNCSYTQVASLEPLADLPALQSLNCSRTQVASLEPLAGLPALQSLDCSATPITSLEPLAGLPALHMLDCSGTQVSALKPLAGLSALQSLNCSRTRVTLLDSLAGLPALQSLNCSRCSLLSFPDAVLSLQSLTRLVLFETPIPGVPVEVMSSSLEDNCHGALRAHFDDLAVGALPLPDVKLMLLGNGKAGKTQLSHRLCGVEFNPDWDSTHGIVVMDTMLQVADDPKPTILHIWDFGGQDIYHGTHALFARARAVFAIVWSKDTEDTGEYERDGIRFRNHPLAYWMEYVRQHGVSGSPTLIVQTKCDNAAEEVRPFPVPAHLSAEYRQDVYYSARLNRRRPALDDALGAAIEWLREAGRQGQPLIGAGRLRVRRRLETLRSKDASRQSGQRMNRTIKYADFKRMCAEERGVTSDDHLLAYLNDAGVVFYRKGLFGDHIILDHAWALEAIYAVFQRERSYRRLIDVGGRFTRGLLELLVWDGYSPTEQRLFISMMESCGICFLHRGQQEQDDAEYVAPDLLPERAHVAGALAEKWPEDQAFEEIAWRYTLLNPGLIRDVIARIGTHAGVNALYWRDGVCVYEITTRSRALVEQQKDGDWGGTLRLRTQGPQAAELLERLELLIGEAQQRIGLMAVETTRSLPPRPTKVVGEREPRRAEEPRPAELQFGEPPRTVKGWFVSYAWADPTPEGRDRKAAVDRLCREAERAGIRIERDTTSLSVGDSIGQFMARLGDGDRIFIFLSDKYLKSPWCMTELHAIWRTSRAEPDTFFKRVRIYKLPDARYEEPEDRVACARHWEDQHAKRRALIKEHPHLTADLDFRAFKQMGEFHLHIADILAALADRVQPRTFDDFLNYGFADPPPPAS